MKVTENSALWRSFTEASTPSGSASIPQASLIEDKYHLMKGDYESSANPDRCVSKRA